MNAIEVLTGAIAAVPEECAAETKARLLVTALQVAGFAVVPRRATDEMIRAAPRAICTVSDIWDEMVIAAVAEIT